MNSGFQLVHVAGLTSAAGMLMVLSGVRSAGCSGRRVRG